MYFHHHADGYIVIETEAGTYIDTVDNFTVDLGEPYSGIPAEYIGRWYEPGIDHHFYTSNTAFPQNLNWPEGDRYISQIDRLIAAKKQRENPLPKED
jgi:hypothetical protein